MYTRGICHYFVLMKEFYYNLSRFDGAWAFFPLQVALEEEKGVSGFQNTQDRIEKVSLTGTR